ncbi:helix-turn-helix transcriptional regulator [Pseudoxanthobacter sp.]|uniref:helix-turn-helix transcriptional regulator n=1 Tax=Pseudoxanthobacter sp. TaxID=1925742 RepID=UPI002FE1EC92
MSHPGRALKRLRAMRGLKQAAVAEMLGVDQTTVSRWERGIGRPEGREAAALERLLAAPAGPGADRALKRLVSQAGEPVHLICDITHRLLAASPARVAEWTSPLDIHLGERLLRYASDEIRAAEARLPDQGWYEPVAPRLVFYTGANADPDLRIRPGWMSWERLRLEDGSLARLVTTVSWGEQPPPAGPAA